VSELAALSPAYKSALQHLPEEYPDLQRLVGRKFDAILKGRLIDAISLLKKKLELLDPEDAAPTQSVDDADLQGRVRNAPNLGME